MQSSFQSEIAISFRHDNASTTADTIEARRFNFTNLIERVTTLTENKSF